MPEPRIPTTTDIEIAVAEYFNPRRNIVVPNVWWGLGLRHECDLLVMTEKGYATEVEIKISKSDLMADTKKRHKHGRGSRDFITRIKYLYFAVPDSLESCIDLIPEYAGVIVVNWHYNEYWGDDLYNGFICRVVRKPKQNPNCKPFTEKERHKLARLGAMRIWRLKKKLAEANHDKR